MKQLLTIIALFVSVSAFAQTSSADRDSVAQTTAFQKKIRMASIGAANAILADTGRQTYEINFAQIIVSEPQGSWIAALSYGALTNPVINWDSPDEDIQFTINSIFVKYAKAWYKITD